MLFRILAVAETFPGKIHYLPISIMHHESVSIIVFRLRIHFYGFWPILHLAQFGPGHMLGPMAKVSALWALSELSLQVQTKYSHLDV